VKWKGSLFFCIILCAVDEDESLKTFGKCLTPSYLLFVGCKIVMSETLDAVSFDSWISTHAHSF